MAKYIILENECFLVKDVDGKDYPGCFIPTLFPRMGTGHDIFRALESQRVQMYTLLMDGEPVPQDREEPYEYKKGAELEIADRFFGFAYLISWELCHGLALAYRPILRNISRCEPSKQGFC